MEEIDIWVCSKEPHVSQILTGFCMLEKLGKLQYTFNGNISSSNVNGAFVKVDYKGKKIVYDVSDGYQDEDSMSRLLDLCDFYFKRSFSRKRNEAFGIEVARKMYPLGLNYHVSCPGHPLDKPYWKEKIKRLLGIEHNMYSNTYFSVRRFEEILKYKRQGFRVLFATRLWEPDRSLPERLNEERRHINEMRINIIRALKDMVDIDFIGGVSDNPFSRQTVPELIIPEAMTNRKGYIQLLHTADIGIGTMGLHESIGWKTGEYVAAAKAIVNETFHYQIPGSFMKDKNYIEFADAEECIEGVRCLAADPDRLYEMKIANHIYYNKYLRPDLMILNTLQIVEGQ